MTATLPESRTPRGRVRGRPQLYRSYGQELALFNTRPKQVWVGVIVVVAFLLPFSLSDSLLQTLALGFGFAIGALGLNIVTGLAGQVSLGHAFFLGVGAYTAAAISGRPGGPDHRLRHHQHPGVAARGGPGRRPRRGAGRAARHPPARALPGHRDARAGVHR